MKKRVKKIRGTRTCGGGECSGYVCLIALNPDSEANSYLAVSNLGRAIDLESPER